MEEEQIVIEQAAPRSKERMLLFAVRQALLIALCALEDYLGVTRSIIPKHERKALQ